MTCGTMNRGRSACALSSGRASRISYIPPSPSQIGYLRSGDRVLELGCGTGLETIPLAEAGVEILALDISRQMLHELNRKARAASIADRIETRRGPISDLSEIANDLVPGSFDGAFSHFGALNCEP